VVVLAQDDTVVDCPFASADLRGFTELSVGVERFADDVVDEVSALVL
jgi:hypothetical protein